MSVGSAALLLMLSAAALADPPDDRPVRAPAAPERAPPWRNFAVPALESLTLNFGLLAFNNVVTHMPFARVTGESLLHNLKPTSWTFDADYYLTNQFGHPYQGSLTFCAARSSGLSFWWSALYAGLGSLAWELFFEAEPPSMNDQITTTIGGSLLGEALHRSARQLRAANAPSWLTAVGAALLDPLGALNGQLIDEPPLQDVTLDPLTVRWQFGATAGVVVEEHPPMRIVDRTQALVAVLLVSGPPWNPGSTYDGPLSYFELRAHLSFPRKVVGDIFIRGLLSGSRFGKGTLQGVWGLFGEYDYAAPAIVRASAVGIGPGVMLQVQPASRLYLQLGTVLGASPFAAAGQLLDVSPDLGRDYHVGPGLQTVVDLRLLRPHWFVLNLEVRNWLVVGAYTAPTGFESITYVTFGLTVPVWRWLGAGAEATLSDRRATFDGDSPRHDTGLALRLSLSLTSDPLFGVHE